MMHNNDQEDDTAVFAAFPASVHAAVGRVLTTLGPTTIQQLHGAVRVTLDGAALILPYRLACTLPALTPQHDWPDLERTLWACLLTRHYDGHVREAALQHIIGVSEPWVVPYVVQLCGEYVSEILDVIATHAGHFAPHLYGAYLRENAAYWERTKHRIVSYWNEYYRWQHPVFAEYIGAEIITTFERLAAS